MVFSNYKILFADDYLHIYAYNWLCVVFSKGVGIAWHAGKFCMKTLYMQTIFRCV